MKKLQVLLYFFMGVAMIFGIAGCDTLNNQKVQDDSDTVYYTVTFDTDGGNEIAPLQVAKGKKSN